MKKYPELVVYALDGGVQSYILQQAAAGNLPNFKRFIDGATVFEDCRPPFPSITPTCWASFSTGTTPDIHGVTDQDIHIPGTPLDQSGSGYSGYNLLAERFWEAAGRIGKKSLVLELPTSGPNVGPHVRQYQCMAGRCDPTLPTIPEVIDISEQLYIFDLDTASLFPKDWQTMTPSGKWQPQIRIKPSPTRAGAKGCILLEVTQKNERENPNHIEPFIWAMLRDETGVRIAAHEEDLLAGKGWRIAPGGWSDNIRRSLKSDNGRREYVFRMKMIPGDASASFALFITPAVDVTECGNPKSFGARLTGMKSVAPTNYYSWFLPREGSLDTAMECTGFKFDWHKEVIADAMEQDPADIIITYHGHTDSVNHMYRSIFEGVAAATEAEKATAAEAFEKTYKQADEFLGWLYDNVVGPDTVLLLVSDHGAVGFKKMIRPHEAMAAAGMTVMSEKTDTWGWALIDAERSKVVPMGCGNVYVNLKGRDPGGMVDPADYDKTVNEVIGLLQDIFRDPETGTNMLAFAVENKQAGFVGQGGPLTGDIIYGLAGSTLGGYVGGVHACQMPTARSKTGAINALCMISGKGFHQNLRLARPANLYDLAPTLCFALGYPQPQQATGAILFQALEGERFPDATD